MQIEYNPDLPSCQVNALWVQAGYPTATIFGNDDTATCP